MKRFPLKDTLLFLTLGMVLWSCDQATSASTTTTTSSHVEPYLSAPSLTSKYTSSTTTAASTSNAAWWGALNCHDPDIFKGQDGVYYVISTDASIGNTWTGGLQVRSSTDLETWKCSTTPAFTTIPSELVSWCYTNADGSTTTTTPAVWAPCVIYFNGLYYMYYGVNGSVTAYNTSGTLSSNVGHAYIGVATATSPAGPYTHLARIVRSTTLSNDASVIGSETLTCKNTYYGAIDPSIVYDASGNMWMNYGSWRSGIAIIPLNSSTGLPTNGDLDTYYASVASSTAYGTKCAGGSGAAYEGAQIYYPGTGSYYYIFISSGDLNTDYSIKVGRRAVSGGINGAYVDADGFDLTTVVYTGGNSKNFHAHGTKLWGGSVFGSELGWRAPGGMSLMKLSDGRTLMAHHVRTNFFASYYFYLQVRQLWFNDDGWPVVNPNEYAGESLQTYTASQAAGTYQAVHTVRTNYYGAWTNQQGTSYTAVNVADAQETPSYPITLASDGTVKGTASGHEYVGTWALSSSTTGKVTFSFTTFDGTVESTAVTCNGYLSPAYDWSREKLGSSVYHSCLSFSTLASDGECFFGNLKNY